MVAHGPGELRATTTTDPGGARAVSVSQDPGPLSSPPEQSEVNVGVRTLPARIDTAPLFKLSPWRTDPTVWGWTSACCGLGGIRVRRR